MLSTIKIKTKKSLFFCIAMLTMLSAHAAPEINQTVETYPITGNNTNELLATMNVVGPTANGVHFEAVTKYFVQWQATYQEDENSCKITGAHVKLFSTTQFPEWINYATADRGMQQIWDKFLIQIKAHEQGHSHHGVEAANEVESMMMNMPAMESCANMEAIIKDKTNVIISKYKALDNEYDRVTKHGAAQQFA